MFLAAYEEAFKPKTNPMGVAAEQKEQGNAVNSKSVGTKPQNQEDDKCPQSVLEKHGCSVFVPGVAKDKLDWDYLAGYDKVKRDIEDTVMITLTHAHVFDQITSGTRMKDEKNRPKCVLFEGPPGCGKTTSAKIIS